jgi:hypothetical protein
VTSGFGDPGAIGVDLVKSGQIASRGTGGLVKIRKKTKAKKNNFVVARNNAFALA